MSRISTQPLQPSEVIPAVQAVDPFRPARAVSRPLAGQPSRSELCGADRVEISPPGRALAGCDWRRLGEQPGLEEAVRLWAANEAGEPQVRSGPLYPRSPGLRPAAGIPARSSHRPQEAPSPAGRSDQERLAAAEAAARTLRLWLALA